MSLPTNPSDAVRRLNPTVYGGAVEDAHRIMPKDAPAKKRLRQKSGPKLNKTEQAFLDHLKSTMPNHHHHAQEITFQIANGCRYTPDVVSFSYLTGMIIAHEVKGFMRDDAAVKLKVAAATYPKIAWRLVTKTRGGWDVQEILP